MDEQTPPLSEIWQSTVSEMRQNWENFSSELKEELDRQVKDEHSPLNKAIASSPFTREKMSKVVRNARQFSDSGFEALQNLLQRLK